MSNFTSDPPDEPFDLGRARRDQELAGFVDIMRGAISSGDSKALEECFAKVGRFMQPAMTAVLAGAGVRELSESEQDTIGVLEIASKKLARGLASLTPRLRVSIAHLIATLNHGILEIQRGDDYVPTLYNNGISPLRAGRFP